MTDRDLIEGEEIQGAEEEVVLEEEDKLNFKLT